MANAEHLSILKKGVEEWNWWRSENQDLRPDLMRALLQCAQLEKVELERAELGRAELFQAKLYQAKLYQADLFRVNLAEADLTEADLTEADLTGAELIKTNLTEANLTKANLSEANLTEAKLNGAYLRRTDLSGADLTRADLQDAALHGANLMGANLTGANLMDADLTGADLTGANLTGANFTGANLTDVNLKKAILANTDLGYAIISSTIFIFTNLSTCLGLETVIVYMPCIIDFQTLSASKTISKSFFLKIGLPNLLIDNLPNFFQEEGIRFYPAFLSHSWANKPFAQNLYEALIAKGVNVFFDEKKMKPGDDIFTGLSKGINQYDKTILICSEDSLNSWWVDQELELVFEKERNLQKEVGEKIGLLIPIRIDDHIDTWNNGKRMAIKQRVIGDFRDWENPSAFENALNDLIHALNPDRLDIKPVSLLPRKAKP